MTIYLLLHCSIAAGPLAPCCLTPRLIAVSRHSALAAELGMQSGLAGLGSCVLPCCSLCRRTTSWVTQRLELEDIST